MGAEIDQSRSPTIETFNGVGAPTSVENALGQTTINQYVELDDSTVETDLVSNIYRPDPATGTASTSDSDSPETSISYDDYGQPASETSPDGSTEYWTTGSADSSTAATITYAGLSGVYGLYDETTFYQDGLYNQTAYLYATDTGDLIKTQQYASGSSSDPNDEGQNTTPGGDPITTDVYTGDPGGDGPPAGLIASETNPDGGVSAFSYDNAGSQTATFQGQMVALSGGSAAFSYLPQSPGLGRTYTIYVKSDALPDSDTGYTISDSLGSPTFYFSAAGASALLGSGWYELGTETLAAGDTSGTLTVAYTGSGVCAVTLLEQTLTISYNDHEDPISTIDALNHVQATSYDDLDRPVAAAQGQVVVAHSGAAAFDNVPQVPGLARTIQVFVDSTTHTGYSFSDAAGGLTLNTSGSATTPLGGDWYFLGTLTLPASDASSTINASYSGSGSPPIALLQPTGVAHYDPAGNTLSTVDGMGRATINVLNDLEEQTATWQGQVLPVASSSATFSNLPLTPEEYDGRLDRAGADIYDRRQDVYRRRADGHEFRRERQQRDDFLRHNRFQPRQRLVRLGNGDAARHRRQHVADLQRLGHGGPPIDRRANMSCPASFRRDLHEYRLGRQRDRRRFADHEHFVRCDRRCDLRYRAAAGRRGPDRPSGDQRRLRRRPAVDGGGRSAGPHHGVCLQR